jgi:hypothetical protein
MSYLEHLLCLRQPRIQTYPTMQWRSLISRRTLLIMTTRLRHYQGLRPSHRTARFLHCAGNSTCRSKTFSWIVQSIRGRSRSKQTCCRPVPHTRTRACQAYRRLLRSQRLGLGLWEQYTRQPSLFPTPHTTHRVISMPHKSPCRIAAAAV